MRLLAFKRDRRFSGAAALKLLHRMNSATGAICEIRLPPFGARGVVVDTRAWPVHFVDVAQVSHPVSLGRTFEPFGLDLRPGFYTVLLLDRGHRLVQSVPVAVEENCVTVITVYPPMKTFLPNHKVRANGGAEVTIRPSGFKPAQERRMLDPASKCSGGQSAA